MKTYKFSRKEHSVEFSGENEDEARELFYKYQDTHSEELDNWDIEEVKKNKFKPGDKVRFKDGDQRTFIVYALYGNNRVSLGLYDYPDTEQDDQVNTDELDNILDIVPF